MCTKKSILFAPPFCSERTAASLAPRRPPSCPPARGRRGGWEALGREALGREAGRRQAGKPISLFGSPPMSLSTSAPLTRLCVCFYGGKSGGPVWGVDRGEEDFYHVSFAVSLLLSLFCCVSSAMSLLPRLFCCVSSAAPPLGVCFPPLGCLTNRRTSITGGSNPACYASC